MLQHSCSASGALSPQAVQPYNPHQVCPTDQVGRPAQIYALAGMSKSIVAGLKSANSTPPLNASRTASCLLHPVWLRILAFSFVPLEPNNPFSAPFFALFFVSSRSFVPSSLHSSLTNE